MTRTPFLRRLATLAAVLVPLELLVAACAVQLYGVFTGLPFGVDMDIPLRAAERWIAGGQPYLASAFAEPAGRGFPFLYPPYVLPLVTPLLALPRPVVLAAWDVACLAAALVAFDRLAIPRRWWLLALAWTPTAEAVWNGNAHILLFAAFCCAFWQGDSGTPWQPRPRPLDGAHLLPRHGVLATAVGAVKATQVHAWLLVARHAPRAAILGAALLVALVAATLPFTGIGVYLDWFHQLQRASDPNWVGMGWAIAAYVPPPVALALLGASLLAVPFLPRRDAAVWVGLLLTIGAPNIRNYSWLFCLPAMLRVRREVALLVAFAFTTWWPPLEWLAAAVLLATLLASYRFPRLAAAPVTAAAEPAPQPA